MKSAYLYMRVSTDEQKRKGFSLPEQEDRLLRYCELNGIAIKGIFREDFSAKDFNRPEWKKLITVLKKNRNRPPENILFIKWDRFSRNIEYAYQMLGILRGLNTVPMAIDQPINFDIPESIVMLAVYLSIPEAENTRRGKNSSDGMRRARKMGRLPGRAPMGYSNQSTSDGKKTIVPKQPQADLIKWAFELYAKGLFSMSQVRKMTCQKGLVCSKNNFWKILRNPIYCGIITIRATKDEELQFVKAVHEPLISENLFRTVQSLIISRRIVNKGKLNLKSLFPLRGFMNCPYCRRKLTGSHSLGRSIKYRYYHCSTSKCKGRFRADTLEANYEEQLRRITIAPGVYDLFNLVLEDENIFSARRQCLNEKNAVITEITRQEDLMSFARRNVLIGNIDFEDFADMKKAYKESLETLNGRLKIIGQSLRHCEVENERVYTGAGISIFDIYIKLDFVGKRYVASLFTPSTIDPERSIFRHLDINSSVRKVVRLSNTNL